MILEVNQLVKRYKELIALDHFSLEMREGEILGLLGPNGSGKTTLINCVLALLKYDKGEVKIFGKEMSPDSYDIKSKIGVVPQDMAVFDTLTVTENIDYFCGLYVKDASKRRQLVKEAIEFTQLQGYEKFTPRKLSGGLRRRLNIACGIAHKPTLLFLDEPTVAVDAQSRNFILEGIREMNRQGTSVVYTTHYLEEAQQLCSRIVIMDKGKNLVDGSAEELVNMIATTEKIHFRPLDPPSDLEAKLRRLPHVIELSKNGNGYDYKIKFEQGVNHLTTLLAFFDEEKIVYDHLYSERPTLNDVFLEFTGKELSD